jgi:hypothetical protein
MTSFEEYCPLYEGGLLASGGLQKFPQVHFSIRRGPTVRIILQVA